jgi:hypothetical protein
MRRSPYPTLLLAGLCLIAFVMLALLVEAGATRAIDVAIIGAVRDPGLVAPLAPLGVLTTAGSTVWIVAASLVVLVVQLIARRPWLGVAATAMIGVASLSDHLVKDIVRRVRPDFGVDIMMSPRESGPEFVETMVEAGVEGFSLNIEVFSADAALKYLPLKHKASRAHLERTIRRAVELLGSNSGRVRSLIIPGLEEPEQTLEGVDWLASLGCDPVLSPFRPAGGTPLADAQPVSAPVLTEVLAEARRRVIRHGVALGPRCVPCQHNTLTFPWDVNGGAG